MISRFFILSNSHLQLAGDANHNSQSVLQGHPVAQFLPDEQGMEDERAKMEIAFNPRKGSVRAWLALMELLWIWMEGGLFAERRRNE